MAPVRSKLKSVPVERRGTTEAPGPPPSATPSTRPNKPSTSQGINSMSAPRFKVKGKNQQPPPEGKSDMARVKLSLPRPVAGKSPAVPEVTALYIRPFTSTGFDTSLSSTALSDSSTAARPGTPMPYAPQRHFPSSPSSGSGQVKIPIQSAQEEMAVNQSTISSSEKPKRKKRKPVMTLEEARKSLSLSLHDPIVSPKVKGSRPLPPKKSTPVHEHPGPSTAPAPVALLDSKGLFKSSKKKWTNMMAKTERAEGTTAGPSKGTPAVKEEEAAPVSNLVIVASASRKMKRIRFEDEVSESRATKTLPPMQNASKDLRVWTRQPAPK